MMGQLSEINSEVESDRVETTTAETNRNIAAGLSNNLARVLREFHKDFERRIYRELGARGFPDVRAAHGVVFANLGTGAVRVTELAQRAQVTQQAMGKMLKELEQMGYITRAIDKSDKRAKEIRMTERGVALSKASLAATEKVQLFYEEKIGREYLADLESMLREAVRRLDLDYLPDAWTDSKPGAHAVRREA